MVLGEFVVLFIEFEEGVDGLVLDLSVFIADLCEELEEILLRDEAVVVGEIFLQGFSEGSVGVVEAFGDVFEEDVEVRVVLVLELRVGFFVWEVVLEEQVLCFDEVGISAEGFEVLFHVFDLDFAV